ncbi:MAG: hypothetical protein MUP81_06430 [Dehalococcoidia bacterium]|nr:hypothetical protein [Dehalococcoidia bacterium]
MKQLYEVAIYYYVMAENTEEAKTIKPDFLSDCTIFAHKTKTIRNDWWECIPFGSDDDKTCGQIVQEF